RVYLEIIAPDPQQAEPRSLESLGLRATEHPAVSSPKGVQLVGLRAQHPSSRSLQQIYDALGIPLQI
ncbi:MAG: hypothetical protein ACREXP_16745, partial [Steroidobacteraceae bacterium]